jgi:hypothetical protein
LNKKRIIAVLARCGLTVFAVLAASLVAGQLAPQKVSAAISPILITPAIESRPITEPQEVFFDQTFSVTTAGDEVLIASTSDGEGQVYVDDEIELQVTHQDGSTVLFIRNYEFQPPSDPLDISDVLEPGTNTVRVILRDTFGGNLSATELWFTSLVPKPLFSAGAAIDVLNPGGRVECTAGFAVTKNGVRYMLTSAHCLGGATEVDIYPLRDRSLAYAADLDCSGASSRCLVPAPGAHPNDITAWQPDSVRPTNTVMTKFGLQPVLGWANWHDNQRVCRWGKTTGKEVCGEIIGHDSASGYVAMDGKNAKEGDSGGPVYAYAYNPDGTIAGVHAIGITEAYGSDYKKIFGKQFFVNTYFMPIVTVQNLLGVSVLATP